MKRRPESIELSDLYSYELCGPWEIIVNPAQSIDGLFLRDQSTDFLLK